MSTTRVLWEGERRRSRTPSRPVRRPATAQLWLIHVPKGAPVLDSPSVVVIQGGAHVIGLTGPGSDALPAISGGDVKLMLLR